MKKIILDSRTCGAALVLAVWLLHTENIVCQIISISLLAAYTAIYLWITLPETI